MSYSKGLLDDRPSLRPGTQVVESCVDMLIGGVDADATDEHQGSVVVLAECWAGGGCCCEWDDDETEDELSGLRSDAPETWCLRCQAIALLDALDGREPGASVLASRAAG